MSVFGSVSTAELGGVMTPAIEQIFFTPVKANQTLPLVKAIVGDIVSTYVSVVERQERLEGVRRTRSSARHKIDQVYESELVAIEEDLERDVAKLGEFLVELNSLGIELKDVRRGLVDFPALMNGREVCLCWHLGEESVSCWHETDAGFAGRQPLNDRLFFAE